MLKAKSEDMLLPSVRKIQEEQNALVERLKGIQKRCKHPAEALKKTHHSSTGQYDVVEEQYWTNFHCLKCDKYWTEEGSK